MYPFLPFLLLLSVFTTAELLVDYNATRDGNDISMLGLRDLEISKHPSVWAKDNTATLYIKAGTDSHNTPALHFHRAANSVRAEFHCLSGKTELGKTYYIGYELSLPRIVDGLCIFQWKEYKEASVQDVPLGLKFNDTVLQLEYNGPSGNGTFMAWSKEIKAEEKLQFGVVVHTGRDGDGWAQLFFQGRKVTFNDGTNEIKGTTYLGVANPKFGAYLGTDIVDTFVYNWQIGTSAGDVAEVAGW